jgi:hypothetical protein
MVKTRTFPVFNRHCVGVVAVPVFSMIMVMPLRKVSLTIIMLSVAWSECSAVPKAHVITFGRWISAKWPNASGQKMLDLKVRPLFVDTRLKEYTTGTPHEMTDRLFVVRRAFRVNDVLPTDNDNGIASPSTNANAAKWQWQREAGCSSIESRDVSRSLIYLSLIPSIRHPVGIGITSRIAASPKTVRNFMRLSCRWDDASRS